MRHAGKRCDRRGLRLTEPQPILACDPIGVWRGILDGALSVIGRGALLALLIGCSSAAFAEEPPLSVPRSSLPTAPGDAIPFGDWLLYPTVKVFSAFSDNLYQSPVGPLAVAGVGIAPNLVAEWSNGIHHTTLYGNAEVRDYNDTDANIYDRQAGFVQRYEAMRDLIFTFQGDYTHRTNSSSLINSIPDALGSPGSTVLANGNILLPNGTIVTPTGQPVSPSNQVGNVAVGGTTLTNPFDQFTAQASVYKIFDRAFVRVTSSISRTDYENESSLYPDFTVKTFTGNAGVWVSPAFYLYSDSTLALRSETLAAGAGLDYARSVYRAVVGIGSAKIGLFSGALYGGYQGSEFVVAAPEGGEVYGGRLSYYPTREWTWTLTVDETTNIANQTSTSNLALDIGTQSPLLIPLGSSTKTTAVNLQSDLAVTPQFSVTARGGYTRTVFLDTTELEEAWLAGAILNYKLRRDILLSLEYQYSQITANVPLASSTRNYLSVGATYKF